MTILIAVCSLLWPAVAVTVYRLGVADGLSAGRRGRLAGGKTPKKDLLQQIDAYSGRREQHGKQDLA